MAGLRKQSGLAYWELGQLLKENPDNLRSFERGKRPLTALARRLIRHYKADAAPLARRLQTTAESEIKAFPAIEQAILWDSFLLTVRRHQSGGSPIIRLEEHGEKSKRTKRERLHSPAELLPRTKTLAAPRLHVLASAAR